MNNENLTTALLIQLIIIMFVAIYYKIDQIPSKVADCTFEITPETLK